jgi:hypothetical protein
LVELSHSQNAAGAFWLGKLSDHRPALKTNHEARQVARIGCLEERNRSASIESMERSYDVDRIEEPTSPKTLNFSPPSDSLENGFYPDEIETRVGRESDQNAPTTLILS